MENSIQTKICPRCGGDKPLNEFYNRRGKVGNSAYCKLCNNLASILRQQENKRRAIELLGGQCQRCQGKYHPAAFDFHHVDPSVKDKEIKKLLSRSWEHILSELGKCILLCANCHRTLHATQDTEGK